MATTDKPKSSTPPPSEIEDDGTVTEYPIEFETSSVYHPVLVVLWSIAPVALLVTGVVLSGLESNEDDANLAEGAGDNTASAMNGVEKEGSAALCWAVGGVTLLLILYGMFLPRALVVIQDNDKDDGVPPTIAIQATCWMWRFPHVTQAYESSAWKHPAVFRNFATSCRRCVVVHQGNTRWLILLSPTDAKGFVQAVEKANSNGAV